MTPDDLKTLVRTVPDFPKPGILFRDITTLIGHGPGLAATVAHLADRAAAAGADAIAGMEARGFIFGAAVAARLGVGFVPVRKPGKLPVPVLAIDYALEYGTDTLELQPDLIKPGARVVIADDLLATGGTLKATIELARKAGAHVLAAACIIELDFLKGREKIDVPLISVVRYADEKPSQPLSPSP